ncbi:MAG TPA: hypothetical protein IGS53_13725 [Leptolyngbyaceae cyanobacterium M33_DOE_097]|uniref:Uncharacterized protein n=1 Tax=Oscillatoriales cyanobacterium SpSt-418 TaxID=2282169 RepID=A0A7C3KFT1_9CYAN|nr:hypothetical protein [Leptolyngbyaceae cyanobacterium M33_DOE_097]
MQKKLAIGVCVLTLLAGGYATFQKTPEPTVSNNLRPNEESFSQSQPETISTSNNANHRQQTQMISRQDAIARAEETREVQRRSLIAKMKPLTQQMDLLSQRMVGRQQKISNLELQDNQLKSELETHNRNVRAFMMKHQAAVACMGATGVTLDENNQYSEDVKNVATAMTALCGFGVISNGEFRKQVIFVADQLNQAHNYSMNLTAQIKTNQTTLATEIKNLEQEQLEVSRLGTDLQNYETELADI